MRYRYKLAEKGVGYLECPNCSGDLYMSVEYMECLYQQGKVYYNCDSCGTPCKVSIIKNKVWIREA